MAEPQYPSSGAPYDPYAPTQQAYPDGLPPTRALPADEYAQGVYPGPAQSGSPQSGSPQSGYPQSGYPAADYQGGYQQADYQQAGYQQGGYPQSGYPQSGYQQAGYPQAEPAQAAYPQSAQPASALPASGQPVAVVPYSGGGQPYPTASEQVIAQIGEIQVTSTTVRTPTCGFPLRGSQWHVVDAWTTTSRIPGWAIGLAIGLLFCVGPLSLLFLLAKTSELQGQVQVHVANGQLSYVSRIVVNNQAFVQHVYAQVNYVRALSAL